MPHSRDARQKGPAISTNDLLEELFAKLEKTRVENPEETLAALERHVCAFAQQREWGIVALLALAGHRIDVGKAPNLKTIDQGLTRLCAEWER